MDHQKAGVVLHNATIKAVAKDAGVSVATVSRVINSNCKVSAELVEAVNKSIAKLNYYPNTVARSLKFDSTLSIGLIISDISNSFFCFLARTIEDVIHGDNYNMIVCSTDNQQDKELSYLRLLLGKKVDGIIINTTGMNDELITSVSHVLPVVLCGRKIHSPSFHGDFVDSDNEAGSYTLTRHLIEHGHRRIAIVNGQRIFSSAAERLAGFARAMKTIGVAVDEGYPYLFEGNFTDSNSGTLAAKALLSLPAPPTAIIAMNNELAAGVLRYCHDRGIHIPQDLSICSYGKIFNNDLLYVQPSYVTMDPTLLGHKIASFMLERIAGKNQHSNREMRLDAQLVKGTGVSAPASPD